MVRIACRYENNGSGRTNGLPQESDEPSAAVEICIETDLNDQVLVGMRVTRSTPPILFVRYRVSAQRESNISETTKIYYQ